MRNIIFVLIITSTFCSHALADNAFLETGGGFAKSADSIVVLLRYQRDTSRLFKYPSYWEGVGAYWDNHTRASAVGIARGVDWNRKNRESYATTAFGLVLVNRTTEHLGTRWQFYFRASYDIKLWNRTISLGVIHFSNGKSVFKWKGPNTGENFLTVSMGLF